MVLTKLPFLLLLVSVFSPIFMTILLFAAERTINIANTHTHTQFYAILFDNRINFNIYYCVVYPLRLGRRHRWYDTEIYMYSMQTVSRK